LEGKPLCDGLAPGTNEYTNRAYLAQLIALLGNPHKELLDRGTVTPQHFDSDGGSLFKIQT
jgi:hypothetical protein